MPIGKFLFDICQEQGGFMIAIVAIVGKNRVIGSDGQVPWRIAEDLRRFKELTIGNTVVMGRRTFESIGAPLAGRDNVIVTRNREYQADGCRICHSIEQALEGENVFIIGGGQIYRQTVQLADRMYLTLVGDEPAGDTFFPVYDGFEEISREQHNGYSFVVSQKTG